jgi:hypothetical protein
MDPLVAFMDCYKPLRNPLSLTSLNLYSYYTSRQYLRPLFGPLTETPYLSMNYYGPVKTPYGDPLPFCEPLRTYYPPLWTTIRPLLPAMYHTTLYSMADISKQINKSQEKWS